MAARRRRTSFIAARKAAGFTQEKLAEALYVDRSTVIRWENGRYQPVPYLWPKLAGLLGVSKERLQELLTVEHRLLNSQTGRVPDTTPQFAWRVSVSPHSDPLGRTQNHGRMPMRAELLTQYESLTDNYRQIDYQAGARAVYGDTVAHLNRLLAAADDVPSALYRQYVDVLGDTTQLAAWLAINRKSTRLNSSHS